MKGKIIAGILVVMLAGGFMTGCIEAPTEPEVIDVVEVVEIAEVVEEREDTAENFYDGLGYNTSQYKGEQLPEEMEGVAEAVELVEDISSGMIFVEMVQDEEFWDAACNTSQEEEIMEELFMSDEEVEAYDENAKEVIADLWGWLIEEEE